MNIVQAQLSDFEIIKRIVQTTINTVYPHYYPAGAVKFFLEWHSDERIKSDISNGSLFLLQNEGATVGTVVKAEIIYVTILWRNLRKCSECIRWNIRMIQGLGHYISVLRIAFAAPTLDV